MALVTILTTQTITTTMVTTTMTMTDLADPVVQADLADLTDHQETRTHISQRTDP